MPRLAIITAFLLLPALVLGCNNNSRRGIGGTPGSDTGTTTIDGGAEDSSTSDAEPDAGDDATVPDTSTPPPPRCDDGFTSCGGMCVDTSSDDFHCGGCDIVCSGGFCDGGECVPDGPTCPSPRVMCGESCVDTQTNRSHCGGCFSGCTGDEACRSGRCVSTCTPSCGSAVCGADGCGGTCGTCGSATTCVSGVCEPDAPPGDGERCLTAIPIFSTTTFRFAGHTADHTPFSCGTSGSRVDVAFAYTAILGGPVTVTAVGSAGGDTMLSVFSSTACNSGSEVACNDDSPTSGGVDSELTFTAAPLTTYYIVVASYYDPAPADTITVTVTDAATP